MTTTFILAIQSYVSHDSGPSIVKLNTLDNSLDYVRIS